MHAGMHTDVSCDAFSPDPLLSDPSPVSIWCWGDLWYSSLWLFDIVFNNFVICFEMYVNVFVQSCHLEFPFI